MTRYVQETDSIWWHNWTSMTDWHMMSELYPNTNVHQSHLRQKGTARKKKKKKAFCPDFNCCRWKIQNESQWHAITTALFTCQRLLSMRRAAVPALGLLFPGGGVECVERLLQITPKENIEEEKNFIKPASQPSGIKLLEVSAQTSWKFNQQVCPKWQHFPFECNMYYIFMCYHHLFWPLKYNPFDLIQVNIKYNSASHNTVDLKWNGV